MNSKNSIKIPGNSKNFQKLLFPANKAQTKKRYYVEGKKMLPRPVYEFLPTQFDWEITSAICHEMNRLTSVSDLKLQGVE